MPLRNDGASADENFFASSSASSITTFAGAVPAAIRRSRAAGCCGRRPRCARAPVFRELAGELVRLARPSRPRLRIIGSRILAWILRRGADFQKLFLDARRILLRHFPFEKHLQGELAGFSAECHLAAPRLAAAGCAARLLRKLARELRHFDRGEPRFVAFIAALQSRAVDGLLERVAGEHAKNHRHAGIELRELNAARRFRRDVIEVRGFAAQDAADADHGVEAAGGASFFAASGISNEPGTRTIRSASQSRRRGRAQSSAPASRRSVIKLLKWLTTMPKRRPAAFRSPRSAAGFNCPLIL